MRPGRGARRGTARAAVFLPLAVSAAYAAFYLPLGIQLPYLPLWMVERGLSPQEIGIALAIPFVARLVATPVLGFLSDHWGRPRAMLTLLACGTVVFLTALTFSEATVAVFVLLGLAAFTWNPGFALLDSYTTRLARTGAVDYGRARLWGSGAFIVANMAGGALIGWTGAAWVVPLMLAGHVAYLAAGLLLPELPRPEKPAHAEEAPARVSPYVVAAVVGAGLVQASHAILYAFGSVNWSARGFSLTTIGVLWAVGVMAEMVLFHWGTAVVRRFGPHLLIATGGLAALVRFGALAFEPPLALLMALQMLHGLSFGATYLGMVELVARTVSEHRSGAGQALASWTVGLATASASLLSGTLWAHFGPLSYLSSAGLGLLGALVALASARQPHNSGSGGKTRAPS